MRGISLYRKCEQGAHNRVHAAERRLHLVQRKHLQMNLPGETIKAWTLESELQAHISAPATNLYCRLALALQTAHRLGAMQMDGIGVPGWRDRGRGQHAADLAAMVTAVQDDMGQHLLPRHATLVAIGEGEGDRVGKPLLRNGFQIIEIPAIDLGQGDAQLERLRRIRRIVARIAMGDTLQMRSENPRHDMDVVHQTERGVALSGVASRIHSGKPFHELIIRPGLVGEQALQQSLGAHLCGPICVGEMNVSILFIFSGDGPACLLALQSRPHACASSRARRVRSPPSRQSSKPVLTF
ncbi:hypothetical protein MPLDJ20_170123 [Mesorhizobium plurifarium]|uniref:Uncharacterized protein n=1 Tax=Mesorhizobium plurifarium TaxID=69974 RepID=A0A090EX67_MESPL|nr:hypothetical protein MPLDJ20_170123 [Mesorhizobium plurifarium]